MESKTGLCRWSSVLYLTRKDKVRASCKPISAWKMQCNTEDSKEALRSVAYFKPARVCRSEGQSILQRWTWQLPCDILPFFPSTSWWISCSFLRTVHILETEAAASLEVPPGLLIVFNVGNRKWCSVVSWWLKTSNECCTFMWRHWAGRDKAALLTCSCNCKTATLCTFNWAQ